MLFNREQDIGIRIAGYVVPDGYETIPRLRVSSDGDVLLEFEANEIREVMVTEKRHVSGRCGFFVDTSMIPDLAARSDIEIHDVETGLLIYRRPRETDQQRKIFRLETDLFPHWRLDDALKPYFQYHVKGAENYGRETVTQLFQLYGVHSVYLSGRVLYRNYAHLIEEGHEVFTMLQDPYHQLAERLLVLGKLKALRNHHIGARDLSYFEPTIAFAESLSYRDEKELRRSLRQMPSEVATTLANPLVRQLTATTPHEMPAGGALAAALDLLSCFAVVGLRSAGRHYVEGVAELLNVDPDLLPEPPRFDAVDRLAGMLRETKAVDVLLEKDQEIYHHVSESFRRLDVESREAVRSGSAA